MPRFTYQYAFYKPQLRHGKHKQGMFKLLYPTKQYKSRSMTNEVQTKINELSKNS